MFRTIIEQLLSEESITNHVLKDISSKCLISNITQNFKESPQNFDQNNFWQKTLCNAQNEFKRNYNKFKEVPEGISHSKQSHIS